MSDSTFTAAEVYEECGRSPDIARAMVRVEKFGSATIHGVTLEHAGYLPGTEEFQAGTSLYRIRQ